MDAKEKIRLINAAIDDVLSKLNGGTEISEYQIDNIRVKKRSAFELITELRKIKALLTADLNKAKGITYVFGGRR